MQIVNKPASKVRILPRNKFIDFDIFPIIVEDSLKMIVKIKKLKIMFSSLLVTLLA